jgi:vancomycin permeability regulator SanA
VLRQKLKRKIALAGLVVFLVLFFSENYQIMSEKTLQNIDTLDEYNCGVVLTGAAGRIREAFEILAQKKIKKLVISGVFKEAQLNEIFPPLPFYPEINTSDVILEKRSETTFGNAVQSLALIKTLQCKNVLLITSHMHMHRAYKIFKTIYPETIPIQKYAVFHQTRVGFYLDLLLETFKSVFYTVFGQVL